MSFIVAVFASIPYIYGSLNKKEGLVFLGRSVVNSADTYTHLANIISAKEGHFILPNLYTPELKTPFIVRPTYYFLGFIAGIFNLSPLVIMHLGRFSFTIIFVCLLSELIGLYIKDKYQKFITLLIALFSSGIGFFLAKSFPLSIDLWVPEANTFFMLLESTHFVSTQVFMLLFILLIYKYFIKLDKKYLILSSIFASLTIIEHPYLVPFVIIFSFLLFIILPPKFEKVKLIKNSFLYFLLPVLSTGFIYKLYYLTPAAHLTLDQTILPTPSIENVLYGYGLLLPFLFIGFYISDLKNRYKFSLLVWIGLTFILIYSPFPTQRRFLEGFHIPIAIVASFGIIFIYKKIPSKLWRLIYSLSLIIILPLTNISNISRMIQVLNVDSKDYQIYYLDKDETTGMEWLALNSSENEVVLANQFYSNIIPGITGRFVYHGHNFLTYKPKIKQQLFNEFMKASDDKFSRAFLTKFGINYIYFGKNDPNNNVRPSFEKQKYLEKIYEKNGVLIYKVIY